MESLWALIVGAIVVLLVLLVLARTVRIVPQAHAGPGCGLLRGGLHRFGADAG